MAAQEIVNARQKTIFALLSLCHLTALSFGAFYKFVDGDEGGMLVVAKEVINGRVPILDIVAHNQPLMYYFYGVWMKVFGFNIVSARFLSATAIFLAGIILFWWARRVSGDFMTAIVLYVLFAANPAYLSANITVKPYALANLFAFASFAMLTARYVFDTRYSTLPNKALLEVFWPGVLLGTSLGMRFVFTLPVAFALWIIFVMFAESIGLRAIASRLGAFTAGVLIPVAPAIMIFFKEPLRAFTIWGGGYGQIYLGVGSNPDFVTGMTSAEVTHKMLSGLKAVLKTPDTMLLLFLIGASLVVVLLKGREISLRRSLHVYLLAWLSFGAILWVVKNLFLNYLGYRNQLAPFAIALSLPVATAFSKRFSLKQIAAFAVVFILLFTGAFYIYLQKKLKTDIFLSAGTGKKSSDLIITPGFIRSITNDIIKPNTKEGDVILDVWGAFAFESNRRLPIGFEYPADATLFWSYMPVLENARKYGYMSKPEIIKKIDQAEFPLIILDDPKEMYRLLAETPDKADSYDMDFLREHAERRYDLHGKYFVKPANVWLLFYLPKKQRGMESLKQWKPLS